MTPDLTSNKKGSQYFPFLSLRLYDPKRNKSNVARLVLDGGSRHDVRRLLLLRLLLLLLVLLLLSLSASSSSVFRVGNAFETVRVRFRFFPLPSGKNAQVCGERSSGSPFTPWGWAGFRWKKREKLASKVSPFGILTVHSCGSVSRVSIASTT